MPTAQMSTLFDECELYPVGGKTLADAACCARFPKSLGRTRRRVRPRLLAHTAG